MPVLAIGIPWDPEIARIGGLVLTWHGLCTALGILAGVRLSLELAKVAGYDYDDAYALALVGVPSGVAGARLLYVAERWEQFSGDPAAILRITEGGISIWGAILGGVGGALLFGLWKGYPVGRGLDLGAFGLLLGQAIGRIGDLVNGEHLARASDLSWAVYYTHADSPAFRHSIAVGPHHPATTYELIGDLAILGALFWLFFGPFWRRPGLTFCAYAVGYAALRFPAHLPARRFRGDAGPRAAYAAAGLGARAAGRDPRGLVVRHPSARGGAAAVLRARPDPRAGRGAAPPAARGVTAEAAPAGARLTAPAGVHSLARGAVPAGGPERRGSVGAMSVRRNARPDAPAPARMVMR